MRIKHVYALSMIRLSVMSCLNVRMIMMRSIRVAGGSVIILILNSSVSLMIMFINNSIITSMATNTFTRTCLN